MTDQPHDGSEADQWASIARQTSPDDQETRNDALTELHKTLHPERYDSKGRPIT